MFTISLCVAVCIQLPLFGYDFCCYTRAYTQLHITKMIAVRNHFWLSVNFHNGFLVVVFFSSFLVYRIEIQVFNCKIAI